MHRDIELATHPQEIAENGPDWRHLESVHEMEMAEEDKIAEQELLEKALRRENQSLLKEHRAQEARDAAVTASRVSEVRESLARAAVTWKGNAEADAVRQVLLTAGAVSVRLELVVLL